MSDGGVIVPPPPRVLRCRTAVGVLGEDWKEFNTSAWETENRFRFRPKSCVNGGRPQRPDLLITRLDGSRRHNPQALLTRHINQLGKKPVCAVRTLLKEPPPSRAIAPSMYTTQFKYRQPRDARVLVLKRDFDKRADGIIPHNSITSAADVREEMMLPVGQSVEIPSLENPHTYLPRRKRVPTPYSEEGVFYSESQCSAVNSLTGRRSNVKVGITNLTGHEFTRRRFVPPPKTTLTVNGFDGGPPPVENGTFQTQMMPFMRAKTII